MRRVLKISAWAVGGLVLLILLLGGAVFIAGNTGAGRATIENSSFIQKTSLRPQKWSLIAKQCGLLGPGATIPSVWPCCSRRRVIVCQGPTFIYGAKFPWGRASVLRQLSRFP